MIKVYEVKETTAGTKLITNMYSIQILIQDIIRIIENGDTLDYDDYIFTNTTLAKVERALQKVDKILRV